MSVTIMKNFRKDGTCCHLYEVSDGTSRAVFSDLGATWISFFVRDKEGNEIDVLRGPQTPEDLMENSGSKGAVIGRNANRISGGTFKIDEKTYRLEKNNGNNNLHSGPDNYKFRRYKTYFEPRGRKITFSLYSPDGDQGFPGNLNLHVTYTLKNGLVAIEYEAVSDKKTVINLTNHAYFNLDGCDSTDIKEQLVSIEADYYSKIDKNFIPQKKMPVRDTPMDFRVSRTIGEALGKKSEQLNLAGGFDHNFFINDWDGTLKKCASAKSLKSGISMEVYTDLPCVQFYTGNGLEKKQSAYCFETQYPPNAVNKKSDICPIFDAGELYRFKTLYIFNNI